MLQELLDKAVDEVFGQYDETGMIQTCAVATMSDGARKIIPLSFKWRRGGYWQGISTPSFHRAERLVWQEEQDIHTSYCEHYSVQRQRAYVKQSACRRRQSSGQPKNSRLAASDDRRGGRKKRSHKGGRPLGGRTARTIIAGLRPQWA